MVILANQNKNNELVDELSKFLFSKLNEKNMGITKFRTQKAIFQIKMELGENHPLFEYLPYYWYYFGPFSNYVADSYYFYNDLNSQKITDLTLNQKEEFKVIYEYFSELEEIVENLLKNQNYFYKQLHKDIYKYYAPSKCMYSFKFEIFDIADKYRLIEDNKGDSLIDTFFKCESKLPFDSYFTEFSDIFSNFTTKLDLINEENGLSKHWDILREPIKKLWCTFAEGLRVQFKDKVYENMNEQWDLEFNKSIGILNSYIAKAEELIIGDYSNSETSFNEYTNSQKRILDSTIGNYLKSE
ncbi:MAG: hypothetical protein LBT10_06435 [Methanobrevibacter sp.]|jgi:hypothetical protein|nr:hypothetical protein [Methanobrevibacter sp.]